ncbi:hypothetical protein GpartN1_g4652.t1 [Galdieria partita]|uniref:SHSP domain-containing protein n=1 Tax=Galdieria partita TaxID=83374 RepID=A0A9C7PYE8_9RHOD|nr:hypothetical protein GpartN1_g4652.t1 [Galdieria partita]
MSELVRPGRFFDSGFGDLFSWTNDPFFRDSWNLLPRTSNSESQLWSPRVDLIEKEDAFLVKAEVPGVPRENIKVDLKGDILSVSGEKADEKKSDEEREGTVFHRMERSYGKFERSIRLPKQIDKQGIKASCKDGILTVTVPKKHIEKSESQKIEISYE